MIAALLWPGYWDPTVSWISVLIIKVVVFQQGCDVHIKNNNQIFKYLSHSDANQGEWMCAPICEAPEDVAMTCDDCKMGIKAKI